MNIAFFGLRGMGSAMTRNLLEHGHQVTVWNRNPEPAESIHALGALIAATPAEAERGAEIAITMLANDEAVESVTLGANGLAAGLAKGAAHVSMSTISVALSECLTTAHAGWGQQFVFATVFGRPDLAQAGRLFIAAAGSADVLDHIRPALQAVGQRTFVIGDTPSQANLLKLAGNFLITCVIDSLAEAFTLTAKGGIETSKVHEFLTETLFAAPVYRTYGEIIASGRFSPGGFKMALGQKDNRLVQLAAEKLEVPLRFAGIARDRFLAALAHGRGPPRLVGDRETRRPVCRDVRGLKHGGFKRNRRRLVSFRSAHLLAHGLIRKVCNSFRTCTNTLNPSWSLSIKGIYSIGTRSRSSP